jgi:hypothetical protein
MLIYERRVFEVVRLWSNDVLTNPDGVYRAAIEALARCAPAGAAPSSSCG